jgi:hypothetical protein
MLPSQQLFDLRQRRKLLSLGLLGGLGIGASVAGCRGPDLAYDCDVQRTAFYEAATEEAVLKGWIPDEGPYAMSLSFSESGINKLLESLLSADIPFAGEFNSGTLNLQFTPEEAPNIEIIDAPGCDNCVRYTIKFAVDGLSGGGTVATGLGEARMIIPLVLDKIDAKTTALSADYENLDLEGMDLQVFGFDSDEHTSLAGAMRIIMQEELRERFSKTELFRLGSWSMGDGEIELLARELQSFPDKGTLSIGLQTNLELGDNRGFELEGDLPEDAEFGVRIENDVFTQVAKRMLSEGVIPRLYNEDGNPDPNGNYGATMVGFTGRDNDDLARLEARFRIWRIEYGYCGYAETIMPIDFEVEEGENAAGLPTGEVTITPGDIEVVTGSGVGAVAAKDDELVQQQQGLVEIFKQELVESMDDTLNYEALDLADSNVWFKPSGVRVNASSVHLDSTFEVFASPDGGGQ